MRYCTVEGCSHTTNGRQVCFMHSKRLQKTGEYGSPEPLVEQHRMRKSLEYETWRAMKERCYNPNSFGYKNYGGRGIEIYEPWRKSFIAFYQYVGKKPTNKHTLDRINNNGNYEPGNVRWATKSVQSLNRKISGKSKYRGVTSLRGKWMAVANKRTNPAMRLYLGAFKTEEEAALAYDIAAIQLWGENAKLNFLGYS